MMRYLKQYKFLLFLTVLFTAISSLSYVFIAILLQQVMDIVDMGDMDGFIRILLFSLSITIPQNTMLALVGPSGSGKSTIAKLLAGYWDADDGTITIGGTPIKELSIEQLMIRLCRRAATTCLVEKSRGFPSQEQF